MGKRKQTKGEYNDYLDGEKLIDNTEIRTALQGPSTAVRPISPPPTHQGGSQDKSWGSGGGKGLGKGKGKKAGDGGASKKPPLTHFLCLPLVNEGSRESIAKGLEKLGRDMEGKNGEEGIVPRKAVRPVGALHLTLGVMSLDDEHLSEAQNYLQSLDLRELLKDNKKITEEAADTTTSQKRDTHITTDTTPLSINLQGLVPMQRAKQTSTLYAEPHDASGQLYPFASKLRDQFQEKGFLLEDKRALKLHATIINTIYAKPKGKGKKKAGKQPADTPKNADVQNSAKSELETRREGEGQQNTTAPPDPSTAETEAVALPEQKEYEPDRSEGHGPNAKSWRTFNATGLIEQYKDFNWAQDVKVDRVQICKMGAKKILDEAGEIVDERYEAVFEKTI